MEREVLYVVIRPFIRRKTLRYVGCWASVGQSGELAIHNDRGIDEYFPIYEWERTYYKTEVI